MHRLSRDYFRVEQIVWALSLTSRERKVLEMGRSSTAKKIIHYL